MRTCLFILSLVVLAGAQGFDSLIMQSKAETERSSRLKGIFVGQLQAAKKFPAAAGERVSPVIPDTAALAVGRRPGVLKARVDNLERMLDSMNKDVKQLRTNDTQIRAILIELQKQSKSHTNNQNLMIKLFEVFLASFLTPVAIAIITLVLKKKKQ
jgi:hypothetical protein